MASKAEITLAFDAYGTLLSTESIARQLATHFGAERAAKMAQDWRRYQLEYTWRLNSMNKYEPFSSVTRNALSHALAESSATLAPADMDALMAAYDTLSLFPDAGPLLAHLESAPHIHPVIFSNGTAAMIAGSLAQSADLAPHAHVFRQVVVVEPVERFKPCAEVYRYLCGEVGKRGREGEVWLVSSNPFDVVGAKAVGIRTCWVDRSGVGWADRLVVGSEGRPDLVVKGLDEVVGGIEGWMGT